MGKNYLTRGIDKVLILPFIQATIRTASKGKQKEIHDRSSVEVEQLLPVMEPVHDPRNLYASDSPEIEDPDSDEELYKSAEEVAEMIDLDGQGDGAANESNLGPNVFLLFDLRLPLLTGVKQPRSLRPPHQSSSRTTAPVSHHSRPSFSQVSRLPSQVLSALPQNPDRAGQCQGELGGSSVRGPLCGVVRLMTLLRTLMTSNREAKHTSSIYSNGLQGIRTLTPLKEPGVVVVRRCTSDAGGAQCAVWPKIMQWLSVPRNFSVHPPNCALTRN
jgi:hypothetical protein